MKHDHVTESQSVHGAVLRVYEVGGLVLSETAYRPSQRIPAHLHEGEAYFNFVLRGGLTEHCGRRAYELGQSALVYHAAEEARSNQFHDRPTRLFNVRLDARWVRGLFDRTSPLDASIRFNGGRLAGLAARLYREFREGDSASPLIVEGLTLEMLGESARVAGGALESAPPRYLALVEEMLRENFREGVSLSAVAAAARVHPAHLSRSFRRHFRCTVGDYVRRLRIEYACRQLAATRATLTEIASEAGFSDQSHFSRTFKRLTGLTPARYRAESRPR